MKSNAMRLCLLADGFPSKNSASYVFVEQLVNALVDLGVAIDVIVPQSITKNIIRRIPFLPSHEVRHTSNGNPYNLHRPKFFSAGKVKILEPVVNLLRRKAINKSISKIGYDCVDVLYGHFWHNANALKTIAKKYSKPLFVACGEGDDALEELVASFSPSQLKDFRETVTGVISVSSENKRKSIEFGLAAEENIIVYPNCVDQNIFHPLKKDRCRERLGINETDFIVIFVGGFIHRKGSGRVSQALSKIADENIKAIFIGKPMGGDVDNPSYSNIIFKGAVDHDSLPEYLCAADVFVLPTLKEGCCNAIVEALSCGIPVISSNGAFNDDILDEKVSIRIDPLSVEEIRQGIIELKDNPGKLSEMSKQALIKSSDWSIVNRAQTILNFIIQKSEEKSTTLRRIINRI